MAGVRRFLGVFLVPLVLVPTSAVAHSSRVETNPADGATLDTLPADATVTFDEAPKAADVALAGPDGKVDKLKIEATGSTIKAQLPADGPRGVYTLSYRVVSADGHPVTGSTTFTVTTGPSPATVQPKPTPPPSSSSKGIGWARERSDLVPVALGLALLGIIGAVLVARSERR
jgi:methionine-rich copper-binding protein CopC